MTFNQGHYHEVADRCHVMLCNIEEHLINHPAVAFDECAKKKLQNASDLIAEVYQWAGTMDCNEPAADQATEKEE